MKTLLINNMSAVEKLLIITIVSLIIVIASFVLYKLLIKKQKSKWLFVKIVAIITVLIHYSGIWVDYFTTGIAYVNSTYVLAIYPCHIMMWMLLIFSFANESKNKVVDLLGEFTAIAGIICSFIGLAFNENFLSKPYLSDYHIFKGLLSHVTLLLGALVLFDVKEVKINTKRNMLSTFCGLIIFAIDGLFVNVLFHVCKLPPVNAMYMLHSPFEKAPFINFYTIGIAAFLVVFMVTTLYETIFYKKENRWYSNVNKKNRK